LAAARRGLLARVIERSLMLRPFRAGSDVCDRCSRALPFAMMSKAVGLGIRCCGPLAWAQRRCSRSLAPGGACSRALPFALVFQAVGLGLWCFRPLAWGSGVAGRWRGHNVDVPDRWRREARCAGALLFGPTSKDANFGLARRRRGALPLAQALPHGYGGVSR
jgi:hypothetical protein